MTYCVYKITNLANGLAYVGMTCDLRDRTRKHREAAEKGDPAPLYADIRKFGWDRFRFDVQQDGLTEHEAIRLECELIERWNLYRGPGYNRTQGGEGGKRRWTAEQKRNLSKSLSEYWADPKHRAEQRERTKRFYAENPEAGKAHGERQRQMHRDNPELGRKHGEKIRIVRPEAEWELYKIRARDGISYNRIGKRFGVSQDTARRVCIRLERGEGVARAG